MIFRNIFEKYILTQNKTTLSKELQSINILFHGYIITEIIWKLVKVLALYRQCMFICVHEEMCNQVQWWACRRQVRNISKILLLTTARQIISMHLIALVSLPYCTASKTIGIKSLKIFSVHLCTAFLFDLSWAVKLAGIKAIAMFA